MAYGVTAEGFVRPRLPEIRQEIVADLIARLRAAGVAGSIETRPDSVLGLLIDTFAERESALWEQAEGVYYSTYPGSAGGISLDRSVSFTGVTRLPAQSSRGYVVLYGLAGTLVPAGAQIRHLASQTLWQIDADTTIQPGAAADATVVPVVQNLTTYTVSINGVAYSYTSDSTATIGEILGGLVAALSTSSVNVESNGAALRLWSDGRQAFGLQLGPALSLTSLGSPALVLAATVGPQDAQPGDLSVIVTRIDGWDSVNNLQAATLGRLAENDAELRARYPTGLFRLGAGTMPSLSPNVRDGVPGVSAVKVFENDTDFEDGIGRPPHSVHFVVEGGLDDEVGEAIFRVKGAGIDTFGEIGVLVTDAEGAIHPIYFDRPVPVYIWVRATLTLLPPAEQAFPPDGFAQVTDAILTTGTSHQIGQDVVRQRFFGGMYGTPGIASVNLLLASSTDPAFEPAPEDFGMANIAIQDFQVAKFDRSRIEVN